MSEDEIKLACVVWLSEWMGMVVDQSVEISTVWVWLIVGVTMRDDAGWVLGGMLFSLER